jgi:uncharacterized protein YjbI with pentapeptide repeats
VIREISAEELLERYAAGERNFAGLEVNDVELHGDLTGIDLSDGRLVTIEMSHIILINANLRNAWLTDSCLNAADLTNADLRGCSLIGAKFGKANLTGADLRNARFNNTDFSGANLTGANLIGVEFKGVLRGANLTRANLTFAKLKTNFQDANLTGSNLTCADISEAIFQNTIMQDGSIRSDNSK